MLTKEITIAKTSSMSVAPAALLVQVASKYASSVYVYQAEKQINAKSIMGVMALKLYDGEVVTLKIDGEDEEDAGRELENLLTGRK